MGDQISESMRLGEKRKHTVSNIDRADIHQATVPAEICMENAGCEKCDVTMEMIYYQQKGSLMEPSN